MDAWLYHFFSYFDWCVYTLSRMTQWQLCGIYLSFLIIDGPRYILSKLIMLVYDLAVEMADKLTGESQDDEAGDLFVNGPDAPFVTVLCPGKNERKSMPRTIESLLQQNYEKMEILAIDDGSTDGTWEAIVPYLKNPKVKLYRRHVAGGKSSAANMGVQLSVRGEIIIIVDSDSEYEKDAVREIVRPFRDPRVGGVSGDIRVRNWDTNLITRFQAADYLHSISLGRRFTSWIGTLAICSGAFGAFRRTAVEAVGGWDVGPGEDGDLTIKIRKIGYQIRFAPDSVCYTDVPETWSGWWKQRRRWNRGLIRYKMRKHIDMAIPGSGSFSLTNMLVILDVLYFRVFLCYSFFVYFTVTFFLHPLYMPLVFFLTFLAYFVSNLLIIGVQLFYSDRPMEDLEILSSTLIMYPYRLGQRIIRFISINEELFLRKSYEDPYVPRRVGKATIHW